MNKMHFIFLAIIGLLIIKSTQNTKACTSVLVSRGASADGSVMTSYLYDVAGFMAPLQCYPGGRYEPGDSLKLFGFREGEYIGKIEQIERTYKVIGNMNERQVSIAETTFTGREELHDGDGLFDYGNLMWTTLQRAGTAREAIKIMDELAKKYGYKDTGESFSIADKNEAWVVDFIGKGKHGEGAVWVAARVPEGYIAAHANQARIREVDWNDTENWMWADDVVDFARKMGWFDGDKKDFSFVDAYDPVTPTSLLLCESRVWSVYRRAAPSKEFSPDYWRAVKGAEPYPLFIKPDEKISIEDMIAFVRDHFHDTPFYTGEGFAAGPFNNPYRWRPLLFELDDDGKEMTYTWERTISQVQTAFSFITQARNWLPDEIGGICWYSVDDTYSNAFMPLYMGMNDTPKSLMTGNAVEFDWESAYWVFNLVNNYAYGMYDIIIDDIKKVQKEIEQRAHTMTDAIDISAEKLYEAADHELVIEYLTDFSINNAEYTVKRWRELGYYIFAKYNDRYIRETPDVTDWPSGTGYPQDFLKQSVEERPGYYEIRWREPGEPIY